MFHFQPKKTGTPLHVRMQQCTIKSCDTYISENRPTIRWRVYRWEFLVGFQTISAKKDTDRHYAKRHNAGITLSKI